MTDLPEALRDGLDAALAGFPPTRLSSGVQRLMSAYRSGGPASAPILRSDVDVAAYAAYRMPATFAAVRAALRQVAEAVPDWAPRSLSDVGGGTGAAAWAAVAAFPSLRAVTVLDQVAAALTFGRRLARHSAEPALRGAAWQRWRAGADVPAADLVTIAYLLGELTPAQQETVLTAALATGGAIAVIEPGTPEGYRRVLAARAALLAHGHTIVAPCPHQLGCPLETGDWCHFPARVPRSALHRQLKAGQLGWEDEKFALVVAMPGPPPAVPGRVLRHPRYRKNLVTLQVCTAAGTTATATVTKREGQRYRAARDVSWGDAWPPT
ncbi:Ribosomal protein RSM22 (predicted rRNA methylase) [Pseudonocardia thermophila]|jgi:Predicted rRNA methylase|uniref:Ribosomal protein RSM22 (Predicted rRNA methylase) n=1 Tax=Pseudonocardia thermophila TaxID=1848 RepID=A0A1M7A4N6_PSETH|nr:small ribosomal subunit Rsm22 family protein [Pseudonocardia thermophila]SHL37687.1 Ribosomal protein RSM22 (predicted rRNA methylase) [Pseudonocardia thermophila]